MEKAPPTVVSTLAASSAVAALASLPPTPHAPPQPCSLGAADDAAASYTGARDGPTPESPLLTATSGESTHSESSSSPSSLRSMSLSCTNRKRPSSSQVATTDTPEAAKRKPHTKWYALQKEEKVLLLKEAKYLEARLDFLEHLPQNASAARQLERLERENRMLRDAMKSQQFELAGVQSALANYTMNQQSPFERHINLGVGPVERHEALVALKDQTLRDAERYLRERSRFLDVTQKYSSMEKSTAPNGDFIVQVFEMMPLEGVSSVKHVYDALRFYFFNMDISLTEASGELVVREGKDELVEQNVCQQRLLRATNCGVQIESNCAMLGSYSARDDENGFGREYAIITMDFVNADERFPYKPHERLRQDIAAAITIRTFPRKVSTCGADEKQEFDVVMCRSYFSKMHHSDLIVPPAEVFDNMVVDADMCSREILRTVYDVVHNMGRQCE